MRRSLMSLIITFSIVNVLDDCFFCFVVSDQNGWLCNLWIFVTSTNHWQFQFSQLAFKARCLKFQRSFDWMIAKKSCVDDPDLLSAWKRFLCDKRKQIVRERISTVHKVFVLKHNGCSSSSSTKIPNLKVENFNLVRSLVGCFEILHQSWIELKEKFFAIDLIDFE